jgi:peptidoglycan/LPS O-acetylase OafA/YrhL
MVVFGVAAIGQRDSRPRHGVALIDVAGLAVLAIAVRFVVQGFNVTIVGDEMQAPPGVAWGWELLILAAGFGLIAYSSVDRQPGPAYLGVLNLIAFTAITSVEIDGSGATLLGWPLVLAGAAVFLLAIGLRPTTPAPPPPDIDAPEPPPLPLR